MTKVESIDTDNVFPIYPSVIDFNSKNICGATCGIQKALNRTFSHVSIKSSTDSKRHYISIYPNGMSEDNYITFKGLKYYLSVMTLFYSSVHSIKGFSTSENETEFHILFKRGSHEIILAMPVKTMMTNFLETTSVQFFKEIIKPLRSKMNNISSLPLSQGIMVEELIPEGGYCYYQAKSVKEKMKKIGSGKTITSGVQTLSPIVFYYKNALTIRNEDMAALQKMKRYEFIANDNPNNIGMFVYSSEQDFSGVSNESRNNDIYIDCSPEINEDEKESNIDNIKNDIGTFQFAMLIVVILLIPPIIAFSNRFRVYGMYDTWGMIMFAFTIVMLISCTALFFNYNKDAEYKSIVTSTIIILIVVLLIGMFTIYNFMQ